MLLQVHWNHAALVLQLRVWLTGIMSPHNLVPGSSLRACKRAARASGYAGNYNLLWHWPALQQTHSLSRCYRAASRKVLAGRPCCHCQFLSVISPGCIHHEDHTTSKAPASSSLRRRVWTANPPACRPIAHIVLASCRKPAVYPS